MVTRDGSKARIICTDAKTEYPVIALVERSSGAYEEAISYTGGGHYLSYESSRVNDLFFAPEKHEGWGVICGSFLAGEIFTAKEEAEAFVKRAQSKDFVAIAKIEWEE